MRCIQRQVLQQAAAVRGRSLQVAALRCSLALQMAWQVLAGRIFSALLAFSFDSRIHSDTMCHHVPYSRKYSGWLDHEILLAFRTQLQDLIADQ